MRHHINKIWTVISTNGTDPDVCGSKHQIPLFVATERNERKQGWSAKSV